MLKADMINCMHSVTVWFLCPSFVIIFSVPAPTKTSPDFNPLSRSFMSRSFNCRTDFPTNISCFMKHARKLMKSCLCWSCSKWIWGCFDSKRHTYFFSCGKDHELTPTYKLSDAQDIPQIWNSSLSLYIHAPTNYHWHRNTHISKKIWKYLQKSSKGVQLN